MADELERLLAANGESSDAPTGTMLQPVVRIPAPAIRGETPAFREGDVILHRFRIVRLLGRGGMGEVYEAHDQELGPVALKTIRRDMFGDHALLQRFKQEVQLARQVTSPYVCRIHELFMIPDDGPHRVAAFLTMELLEGTTLAKRIEQGPLPWNEAERIAIELCQGLEALHAAGLVHRDFKPGNAMLAKRGNVTQAVVMDLGLALRPGDSHARPKLTLTGGIVGTPGYMAPEQFEGTKVSAATDVYSLGLVLYEMTTGKRPFEASTPLAAAVKRGKRPPAISSIRPGLPRRLDWIVEKCLEFEPADRFGSAEEVAKALKGGQPVAWSWSPPRRAWLYWATGAVAAGAATAWFWSGIENWRHPLPTRRFVAAMIWPKITDPQSASIVGQLLETVSRELARAEAYDKEFLILNSGTLGGDYTAVTPSEAAGILGANLVLAASLLPGSGLKVSLSVLDPVTGNPLRRDSVSGGASTLGQRATEAAARLLDVRRGPASTQAIDEVANVRPAAYLLFLGAQEQMGLPNNEGLAVAIEKYQAALREDPRYAAAYAGLAIAYSRRYAFQKDQSDLALASRNSKLALEYGPASSRAKFSQALIDLYSGDTENAVRMFRDLLKIDPGNEEVLMYEAQAFRDMNQPEFEERVYQNLLTQRPNYWPAYNDLGLIYRGKGAYQEAANYFLQATRIAPRAAIPWTNLGAAYLLLGKTEEGRDACERAIANHPNEDALLNLGNVAYAARDYSKALNYYNRARDLNPNVHMIWRNIGDCYTMLHQTAPTQKNYQKAAEILAADLQINPRYGGDWMTLAYYSAKLGHRSQAAEQLAEAEKRGAPDLESQLLKAQVLILLGEKEKGINLTLDLLKQGISRVEVNIAVDLQTVLGDPRLQAALKKP